METELRRVLLANAIATLASLALTLLASIAAAQSPPLSLSDIDPPKIDVYPRYPVSNSFVPGPSEFINDDRATVSVVIYSTQCDAPFDAQRIQTSILGNRISVSPVRFGYQVICGFVGSHLTAVVYSAFLRELGPGTYQVVVSGEPGDAPADQNPTVFTVVTLSQEFVVLNLDQAGSALIENPAPGSTQSGIGLISGWACVADRVEISIDGAARIRVPGEMGRADVKPVCGHSTAGFGLLTNFNLLGAGAHTIQAYVKGVAVGEPTRFNVVAPAGEFVTGLKREVTVTDFPSTGKTTTIDWREAEQNFGLKDVR